MTEPPFSAQLVAKDREHVARLQEIADSLERCETALDMQTWSRMQATAIRNEIARWRRAMGLP